MKKILAGFVVVGLIFTLAACSWSGDNDSDQSDVKDINEGLDEFEFDTVIENANLNENINEVVLSEEEKTEALKRDEERIAEVGQIQTALELYLADKGNYPETGDELVPDYLEVWPTDPGEYEYVYTPIGALPAKFYDVSFDLEVGSGEMLAGSQTVSPDEIAE